VPPESPKLRQGPRAAAWLGLGLFVLTLGAALFAIVVGAHGTAFVSLLLSLILLIPTLILVTAWVEVRVGIRAGWIAATLIAAAGIAGTWLTYPLPVFLCSLAAGVECPENPRLQPALIGTVVIIALWAIGTVLRPSSATERRTPLWSRLTESLVIVAAVLVPAVTLWAGGFSIPWW
jgi:hypothetical protein